MKRIAFHIPAIYDNQFVKKVEFMVVNQISGWINILALSKAWMRNQLRSENQA